MRGRLVVIRGQLFACPIYRQCSWPSCFSFLPRYLRLTVMHSDRAVRARLYLDVAGRRPGCIRLAWALIFFRAVTPCLTGPGRPEGEEGESVQLYLRDARKDSRQEQGLTSRSRRNAWRQPVGPARPQTSWPAVPRPSGWPFRSASWLGFRLACSAGFVADRAAGLPADRAPRPPGWPFRWLRGWPCPRFPRLASPPCLTAGTVGGRASVWMDGLSSVIRSSGQGAGIVTELARLSVYSQGRASALVGAFA